jgi:tripartite-type tricarboxylate transporter receptor subunit TctC
MAAAIAASATFSSAVWSQGFPDRPIKLVVPFGAGSAVDTIARAIAAQAGEQMGQAIQIDNRTGANGIIPGWLHPVYAQ